MSISNRKVVIVGAGHVGSHVGYALISQSLADEIVYIDSDHAKAVAQAFDLTDATNYLPVRTKVTAGDYSDAKDAQIMIISAGPLPTGNQTRMDTLGQTIAILKDVTKSIKESGFDGIIVNISNPADVITHYIQHTLNWAPERIFSTSTTLDSARLRRVIAQETGIDQKSITAYALGEHGESQMVAWSAVTIAGKPLSQWREEYPDTFGKLDLDALADAGREGGWTILRGKGVPVTVNRLASMYTVFFSDGPLRNFEDVKNSDTEMYSRFFRAMRERNIFVAPSAFEVAMVSFAHTEEDFAKTLDAVRGIKL